MDKFTGPALTVDAIIQYPDDKIVLIRRGNDPFKGMWALPGGFVDVGETVDIACVREVKEECNIDVEIEKILGIWSDPTRDPRGHTVSIVFITNFIEGNLKGCDDAKEARLFGRGEIKSIDLAFDHSEILSRAGWR